MAKREVEHRQKRILSKVQELVAAGKIHNSGHRPFRYARIYDGTGPRRKIVEGRKNETEAAYIKDWAARVVLGEKIGSLVAEANQKGIKISTGGAWSYQAMKFLLTSGRISGRKEHKGEIMGTAVWPKIIEPEDSNKRALLAERSEEFKAQYGERDTPALKYPLSGLVKCTGKVPHVVGEPCSCKEKGKQHHKMSTGQRGDKKMPIYTCKKDGGGCGGRTIQIPDLEKAMERLLFAQLEQVEVEVGENPDDLRPALEDKLKRLEARNAELDEELGMGDRPVREITASIQRNKGRIAKLQRELAELSVTANVLEVDVTDLREAREDYSVPRKQAVYGGLIEEILIHPAPRPFNVWNPDRIEVFWK
ncbi:recombinase family protein [Streptomyces sp. MA5143a]|uniref:recombinase family protein n=1 Tax=Streptomyces sp. MA5143a TaxID=2083010 RepID=UPI0015E6337E|nr:recombinase family protein [Streptomyces sp. MA5143a]